MNPSVAIVIVNYNGAAYVETAIDSALTQQYDGPLEVIVVDNASTDASAELLRATPGIRLMENSTNPGFGAAVNVAFAATQMEYIALLNPDARADRRWLARMIPWMRAGGIDIASSIVGAGAATYFAGGRFIEPLGATLVSESAIEKTDWICGCALIATSSALEKLNGFDEGFFLYYEDVDLSLRACEAGMRLKVLPETLVDHPSHGRSTGALGSRKAEIGYYARGRLIRKHVHGWKLLPALTFTAAISPLRNGVGVRSIANVEMALFRGFRKGDQKRQATAMSNVTHARRARW